MKRVVPTLLLLLALALALPALAHADGTPKDQAEAFLRAVQAGQVKAAYDKLFDGTTIARAKPQQVTVILKQTQTMLEIYGRPLGFEMVNQEPFGQSLVRLVYLLKFESAPAEWEFYFYKPHDQWLLTNTQFDDGFSMLSAKR